MQPGSCRSSRRNGVNFATEAATIDEVADAILRLGREVDTRYGRASCVGAAQAIYALRLRADSDGQEPLSTPDLPR